MKILSLFFQTPHKYTFSLIRFREHRRNLHDDLNVIVSKGVTDVMVLMKEHEFRKYRVPYLLDEYSKYGITVHHHPMEVLHNLLGYFPFLHLAFGLNTYFRMVVFRLFLSF